MAKKLKMLCNCGHSEFQNSVEKVGSVTYCKECWSHTQNSHGRYDKGCVMPTAAVCPDRDPGYIDPLSSKPENIKCYRGHDICLKKYRHVLSSFTLKKCPIAGCEMELSVTTTELAKVYTCPLHGVVYRAIFKSRERD